MEFLKNYNAMIWIMAIIVFLIMYLVKFPYKKLTNLVKDKKFTIKLKNGTIRELSLTTILNKGLIIITICFGILAQFIYSICNKNVSFNAVEGVQIAVASISMYAIIEKTVGVKLNNPYNSNDVEEVTKQVKEVVKDNKIDNEELKNFLDNIK